MLNTMLYVVNIIVVVLTAAWKGSTQLLLFPGEFSFFLCQKFSLSSDIIWNCQYGNTYFVWENYNKIYIKSYNIYHSHARSQCHKIHNILLYSFSPNPTRYTNQSVGVFPKLKYKNSFPGRIFSAGVWFFFYIKIYIFFRSLCTFLILGSCSQQMKISSPTIQFHLIPSQFIIVQWNASQKKEENYSHLVFAFKDNQLCFCVPSIQFLIKNKTTQKKEVIKKIIKICVLKFLTKASPGFLWNSQIQINKIN